MDRHDVIPHFLDVMEAGSTPGNGWFTNYALRPGEIIQIIYPDDTLSKSKKFIEYEVLVYHREDDTVVSKMYHNVVALSSFGGLADRTFATFRPSSGGTEGMEPQPGSWVAVQCLSGEHAQAVIVGGLRDDRDDDSARKDRGHHLESVFNGVNFSVESDGSWTITRTGATGPDGKFLSSDDEKARGTKLQVLKNGNVVVATPGNAQTLTLDHENGIVRLQGDVDLTLVGSKIHAGENADQPAVLGQVLVQVLTNVLTQLAAHNHPHPLGPTGPPVNAPAFTQIQSQLSTILSKFIYVKENP